MQRIENASGVTAIWGGLLAVFGQLLGWASENATLCGLLIALGGLLIQAIAAAHNRSLKNAEDRRQQEEHAIKMQILRGELPDRRASVMGGD